MNSASGMVSGELRGNLYSEQYKMYMCIFCAQQIICTHCLLSWGPIWWRAGGPRCWSCCHWMPGTAHACPSPPSVECFCFNKALNSFWFSGLINCPPRSKLYFSFFRHLTESKKKLYLELRCIPISDYGRSRLEWITVRTDWSNLR
jgi:hypothetical protein